MAEQHQLVSLYCLVEAPSTVDTKQWGSSRCQFDAEWSFQVEWRQTKHCKSVKMMSDLTARLNISWKKGVWHNSLMGVWTRKWKDGILREKKLKPWSCVHYLRRNNVWLSSGVTPGLILHDSPPPQAQGKNFRFRRGYSQGGKITNQLKIIKSQWSS